MPLVKIKPGLSHAHYLAGDVFDASPAEMKSFGDKFTLVAKPPVVEPESPVVEIDATRGAIRLAAEHGVSLTLSDIIGTGKGGRITQSDVENFLSSKGKEADDTEATLGVIGRLMQPDHLASLTGDDIKALPDGDTQR